MPYRVLITNIPTYVGEEEFYDYVRAHVGGESVVNALLIMRPITQNEKNHKNTNNNNNKNNNSPQPQEEQTRSMSSSGAALVDYETKRAADAARRVDFYVDGVRVMMKAVGTAPAEREAAEKGRRAYEILRCGLHQTTTTTTTTSTTTAVKRPRDEKDEVSASDKESLSAHEVELRLVGIPCEVYGSFLTAIVGCEDVRPNRDGEDVKSSVDITVSGTSSSQQQQHQQLSAVQLFDDVARSVRRATLGGELLSLRRISDSEAIIRVSASTGESLLERAADGHTLNLHLESLDGQSQQQYALFVHPPRPHLQLAGDNFVLAKKHEVLQAMSRMMEITNGKIAGFVDPFGNYLLPSV
ncbi:uncharacterized protein TM35_000044740 [Trypanosoma theileri]|uniref:Uncharacterized protein n=1 Tax=Trypanosoma theileri TaxID=67003 RepID=A0A1X0P755_9TRYP|nr:uncharacterized protein TM35_000044740 [Trypanosoma theileri]ORC92260.1 hypothetical protein TM35_000044740 [Trypanosoma theileri]